LQGRLTLVGTGYTVAAHVTQQALACIRQADRLFYLVPDPATSLWLESLNASAESLHEVDKERLEAYRSMVERILGPVRRGLNVCAAFYGHPGVLVHPAHEAIRQARSEGYPARMLPGVSAVDCLFSDLGIDPGQGGCQMYDATEFLYRTRRFDPTAPLVLWQVGSIGISTFRPGVLWSPAGLRVLEEVLLRDYPSGHEVIVYEAPTFPVCRPKILRVPLRQLASSDVTGNSTLFVPPREGFDYDWEMVQRLAPA
jgi:Tetrapyrrole (Corrin/Porphyrin) Methylases